LRECARCSGDRGSNKKDEGAPHADLSVSLPTDDSSKQETLGDLIVSGDTDRDSPLSDKELNAEVAALQQSYLEITLRDEHKTRIHRNGVFEVLAQMFWCRAYKGADKPEAFTWSKVELAPKTMRIVRQHVYIKKFISAEIRLVQNTDEQSGAKREKEYWEDTWLTPRGIQIARHVVSLNLPWLRPAPAKDSNESADRVRGDSTPSATTT
jgi:hypothetical protein